MPHEAEDVVGVDLVVGEPDVQLFQPLLTAIQRPVDHSLRPVAGVHVLGDVVGGDGCGLYLVDDRHARLVGKDAVGPAFDGEGDARRLPFAGEEDFGGVASPAAFWSLRWMRAPSLARSKPVKRLSMLPVRSKIPPAGGQAGEKQA